MSGTQALMNTGNQKFGTEFCAAKKSLHLTEQANPGSLTRQGFHASVIKSHGEKVPRQIACINTAKDLWVIISEMRFEG